MSPTGLSPRSPAKSSAPGRVSYDISCPRHFYQLPPIAYTERHGGRISRARHPVGTTATNLCPSSIAALSTRIEPLAYEAYREKQFISADELWDSLSPTKDLFTGPSRLIYRGQGESEWKLIPSVLRDGSDNPVAKSWGRYVKAEDQIFLEIYVLREFAEYCDKIGIRIPNDSLEFRRDILRINNQSKYIRQPELWPNPVFFELMALAQHHVCLQDCWIGQGTRMPPYISQRVAPCRVRWSRMTRGCFRYGS